jgi:hypothetical protein
VHGSLGENDEQSVAYGPTPGPLRPALARTASLTHVSTTSFSVVRCDVHPRTTPDIDYEYDSDISLNVKRRHGDDGAPETRTSR